MKTIGKKCTALLLALAMLLSIFVVFGGLKKENVYASADEYPPMQSNMDNVYYFSDSFPLMQSELDGLDMNIIYDTHYLITPQEFNFLVFTGHFWELICNEDANVLAIFEFKTMKPDRVVLLNLFNFLIDRGVKIMLLSPYVYEYTIDEETEINNVDYYDSMYCNIDEYTLFLRNSFLVMMDDFQGFQENTTLLVDGRFAGITSALTEYNLGELCYDSPTLRRIINYIKFGYTTEDELIFEEDLFKDLWQLYYDTYFAPNSGELPDYFADLSVSLEAFYGAWSEMKSNPEELDETMVAQYNQNYAMLFEEYYTGLAEGLYNNNIHILLNVESNKYVDLLATLPTTLTITNYVGVFNATPNIDYLFALAIWPWLTEYRALLGDIYDHLAIIYNDYSSNITQFPIFLWSDEEIPLDQNGLPVITAARLREMTGCNLIFPIEEGEILDSEFLSKLYALLSIE